ncbi:MAG: O-antigen ligase family protein [Acholeplasmataceae bacterium]|nr:O-antigen ligase family protein [Acholeplasmataceae bacterium]
MENINNNLFIKLWRYSMYLYLTMMIAFSGNPNTSLLSSISLYIFIIVTLYNLFIRKKFFIDYFVFFLVVYMAFLAFSFFYTPSTEIFLSTFYQFFTSTVIIALISNYVYITKGFKDIVNAYILGGIILLSYALYLYGFDIGQTVENSNYLLRIGAELGNTNTVGLKLAFLFVLIFYKLLYFKTKITGKIIFFITMIFSFGFSMLTGSKKAIIFIFLGIFILSFPKINFRRNGLKSVINFVFIALLIYILYYSIFNFELFRTISYRITQLLNFFSNSGGSESELLRAEYIKQGIIETLKSPFLGRGAFSSYSFFGTYSHNNYIEILLNTGVIGFFIFYISYFFLTFELKKQDSSNKFRLLGIFYLLSIVILGFSMVYYYDRYFMIFLAGVVAMSSNNIVIRIKGR